MSHEETPREFTATITFVHGEKPFAVGASVGTSRTADHIQRQNGDIYIPLNTFTVPRGQLAVGDRVSGLMVLNPAANARTQWARQVDPPRRKALGGGAAAAGGPSAPPRWLPAAAPPRPSTVAVQQPQDMTGMDAQTRLVALQECGHDVNRAAD